MITVKNLEVKYDSLIALENINLTINNGDFVYLLGPNGGGKTTFIRTINSLIKPSIGSVNNTFKNIGYLPQNMKVKKAFPASVFEVIYSGFKKQYIFPKKQQKEKIDKLLTDVNALHLKNKLISELSGGQLQRVLLVRSLVNDPDLLILDEPTSALDPQFRKFFNEYIDKINKKGTTIIMITHDLSGINVLECRDRVLYIDKTLTYNGIFCDFHKDILRSEKHAHLL